MIYLSLLEAAVNLVQEEYYYNQRNLDEILGQIGGQNEELHKEILKKSLPKYAERLFCYELYHQLRCLIDKAPQLSNNEAIRLQAEVKKDFLLNIIYDQYQLEKLSKEFYPDFLVHNPDNSDHQELIVEVKTNPDNSSSDYQTDLLKIVEFQVKYRFKYGCLIVVKKDVDQVRSIMETLATDLKINQGIIDDTLQRLFILHKSSSVPSTLNSMYSYL